MRKPWIALASITLFAGLVAGYCHGRGSGARVGVVSAERIRAAGVPESRAGRDPDEEPSRSIVLPPPVFPQSKADLAASRSGAPPDREASATFSTDRNPRIGNSADAGVPRQTTPPPDASTRPAGDAPVPVAGSTTAPPAGSPLPSSATPAAGAAEAKSESPKQDGTPAPVEDPESDRHPPVLQFVRFDPAEIRDGGEAVLSVGASDDLSGVKTVFGTVRSPSGAAVAPFLAQDADSGGTFTARITIPRHAEAGEWFVASMQIVDRADNPLNVAFARTTVPPGGVLRVVSEDSDATAPEVHRVTLEKGTVGAGEKNRIVVDVDDDRSGVASVTGSFQSPSKSAFIPFECASNGESPWSGEVAIPANADCCEWTLRLLRVADKANNTTLLTARAMLNTTGLNSNAPMSLPSPPAALGIEEKS
jgi:hypothetical protein